MTITFEGTPTTVHASRGPCSTSSRTSTQKSSTFTMLKCTAITVCNDCDDYESDDDDLVLTLAYSPFINPLRHIRRSKGTEVLEN